MPRKEIGKLCLDRSDPFERLIHATEYGYWLDIIAPGGDQV